MMRLLFLYGPPAVGKLTVARSVAELTGGRLFHNHLTVNLAKSLYEFGSPGFIELRERVWMEVFRHAMAEGMPLLIFTFNPENSVPQRFVDSLFAEVAASGGEVIAVELAADEAAIEERIAAESRKREGKLVDLELYRRLRDSGVFDSPVLPPPRLRIDTTRLSPAESARAIAALL